MRQILSWLILVAGALGVAEAEQRQWIAVAAHLPGVNQTAWRTDVGVFNPCAEAATVEMRLHTDDGVVGDTFEVAAGREQVFEDVVAWLTDEEMSGALEVVSDLEVLVGSRTYTLADGPGTYGQAFDGVLPADGLGVGEGAVVHQLVEDGRFRSNLLLLNTGDAQAFLMVTFRDRLGATVGTWVPAVPAGTVLQDHRPYLNRFGRDDIVAGSVSVEVLLGAGIFVYASVLDQSTGDPTTISGHALPPCSQDVADRIAALDSVVSVEEPAGSLPGARFFVIGFEQPADHEDPSAGTFVQLVTLLHRSELAPMVLRTFGYGGTTNPFESELTATFDANQLMVEHRFFQGSRPDPEDWGLLTIEQAAADHHRIAQSFKLLYPGPWVNTGHSKGGMTALYHRRFYPEDVDATVAYVAPTSFGAPDERYLQVLDELGAPDCRDALRVFQREVLERRDVMSSMVVADYGDWGFDRMGLEAAVDLMALEMPFSFWMARTAADCATVPGVDADDQTIFTWMDQIQGWISYSDFVIDYFEPYFFQASTQLGYPAIAWEHLEDLLLSGPDREDVNLPPGVEVEFDPQAMLDFASWASSDGERLMLIYGETDPWTGGRLELGGAQDSYSYVAPGGNHGSLIASLSAADQAEALAAIGRWLGTEASRLKAQVPPTGWQEGDPPWWIVPPEMIGQLRTGRR
jgi:hypothetical protein